jgi:radical SAM superfamily enzyme YgiQ (UPF0313 family)
MNLHPLISFVKATAGIDCGFPGLDFIIFPDAALVMANICLIQPPIEDFYTTNIRNIPLGLFHIGAMLKNHDLQLLDLRQGKPRKIPFPGELQAVAKYYRSDDAYPFSLYKSYSRFGPNINRIADLIPAETDIFLIAALFTTYIHEVLEIIQLIRQKNHRATIIIGGPGTYFNPDSLFDAGVDFVVLGEGEFAVSQLLDELEKTKPHLAAVPNLVWRSDGDIKQNPVKIITNINELSFADYDIPGTPRYTLSRKRHAMIMASRGCPHRCKFCSIHQTFGTKYRLRSMENVLSEMEDKIEKGFRSFDFEDDHFGGNKRWLHHLLNGIIGRFSDYDLSLQAMNGITVTNLDAEVLQKMKLAGFSSINLSLVTPDRKRQQALSRPFDTAAFTKVVQTARQIGLKVTAYLIIGLPGDTVEDNLQSILFLASLPCLIGPSLFYLVPGTPIFDELAAKEQIPDSELCYRSSFFPYTRPDYSRKSAMTLFRICRIINFMKAAKDYGYQPAEYNIEKNSIVIPSNLSGKQSQITLGFALLELLKTTGKLYGTGKKKGNRYPLVKEHCDSMLLEFFLKECLKWEKTKNT